MSLSPIINGFNGTSVTAAFTLYNAETQYASNNTVMPGIGADPYVIYPNIGQYFFSNSFDFGLPFFYGRSVYTAIEGRNAAGTVGPYYAF